MKTPNPSRAAYSSAKKKSLANPGRLYYVIYKVSDNTYYVDYFKSLTPLTITKGYYVNGKFHK